VIRELLTDILRWRDEGKAIALATVIDTWGSAPRGVGAKMAITAEGEMAGSVSGGCVESAVVQEGIEVLESGIPRLLEFGVADETAWEVGLACGGHITVFVHPLSIELLDAHRAQIEGDLSLCTVTVLCGPGAALGRELLLFADGEVVGELGGGLDAAAQELAREALAGGERGRVVLPGEGEQVELFVEVTLPPPKLVIVGGVHIAVELVSIANILGYHTVVIDPRKKFGSHERFPHADELIQSWPEQAFEQVQIDASTAVAMLTHDPKIDDPALMIALPSAAFYVGALGSTKTQAKRRERLLEAGVTEEQLARLHGPIGLNLGGRFPAEVALAIMAEIVQARHR